MAHPGRTRNTRSGNGQEQRYGRIPYKRTNLSSAKQRLLAEEQRISVSDGSTDERGCIIWQNALIRGMGLVYAAETFQMLIQGIVRLAREANNRSAVREIGDLHKFAVDRCGQTMDWLETLHPGDGESSWEDITCLELEKPLSKQVRDEILSVVETEPGKDELGNGPELVEAKSFLHRFEAYVTHGMAYTYPYVRDEFEFKRFVWYSWKQLPLQTQGALLSVIRDPNRERNLNIQWENTSQIRIADMAFMVSPIANKPTTSSRSNGFESMASVY